MFDLWDCTSTLHSDICKRPQVQRMYGKHAPRSLLKLKSRALLKSTESAEVVVGSTAEAGKGSAKLVAYVEP